MRTKNVKLLSELLGLVEAKSPWEAQKDEKKPTKKPKKLYSELDGFDDLVDAYLALEGIHSFEGERGVDGFGTLVEGLGYDDLDSFLIDNPGCLDAMVEWVKEQGHVDNPWGESLKERLDEHDEDEQERSEY